MLLPSYKKDLQSNKIEIVLDQEDIERELKFQIHLLRKFWFSSSETCNQIIGEINVLCQLLGKSRYQYVPELVEKVGKVKGHIHKEKRFIV